LDKAQELREFLDRSKSKLKLKAQITIERKRPNTV
jgi:hypothetical protein